MGNGIRKPMTQVIRLFKDNKPDLEEALRSYPVIDGLSSDEIAKLTPTFRVKRFRDEDIVCHCPDASHDAFIVLEGVVATTVETGAVQHVVRLERMGAVFNVEPILGLENPCVGAKALGDVRIAAIDNAMLLELASRDTALGYKLIRSLSRRALGQCGKALERTVSAPGSEV